VLASLFSFASKDLGIDLGTDNTLIYVKSRGIVSNEPSVVAVHENSRGTRKIISVGTEARKMLGKTPGNIVAVQPLRDGVIADFETTEAMLRHFIHKIHNRKHFARPRVVISVPSVVTPIERRAVKESAESAGAREVYLIEEPLAAAIGVGMPITEPSGNMIVDIGGGTTEVAVISLAGIVYCNSVRVAGDKIDEAIVQYLRRKYGLLVGERTAERIKVTIGSACPGPDEEEMTMEASGRDLTSGIPKTLEISSREVREAIAEPVNTIVDAVRIALERMPPELASDIVDKGIVITGGGALLKNLDLLISSVTHLPVIIAENPLTAVVEGAGRALDEIRLLKEIATDL